MRVTRRIPSSYDHVGSFLRPKRLKEARAAKARGELTPEELAQVENEEIEKLVQHQIAAGLKSITDGEFRRTWWQLDYQLGLQGTEFVRTERGIPFAHVETEPHGFKIADRIRFENHPMLDHFRFLKHMVEKHGDGTQIAKMTIPSPSMFFFREELEGEKHIYANEEELFADLAVAYKDAVQAFYDAGCRYLQLDDTAWSLFFSEESKQLVRARGLEPDRLARLFADTINQAIADKPEDLTVTMHICRGNYRSSWAAAGGYEDAAELIFGGLDVDGLFLEFDDERSGGFEPLENVNRKDLTIVLGLITTKRPELEDADEIKHRIEEASKYVDLSQLALSPQCGFASTEEGNELTEEEQWAKIRHVVAIAKEVWT